MGMGQPRKGRGRMATRENVCCQFGGRRFGLASPMTAARKDRKPWPMKWIVLAIVALRPAVHLPDPALPPARARRSGPTRTCATGRTCSGSSRRDTSAWRSTPAAPPSRRPAAGLATSPAPGGLPEELGKTLVESPLLPLDDRFRVGGADGRLGDRLPDRAHLHARPTTSGSCRGPTSTSARARS